MRRFIRQGDRHERADQLQLAPGQLGGEPAGVGRHEAPVPELGAGVSGGVHLVEHGGKVSRSPAAGKFQDAPGAGRVRNTNHWR
jgi:hypothetical protein